MGALSDGTSKRKNRETAVRRVQKDENTQFSKACYEHGADQPVYGQASKRVNDRTFQVTPDGSPDKWPEDAQMRQAIAKRRATERVNESDPQSSRDIVNAAGDGATQAREEISKYGLTSMWDWLLGKRGEKPIVVDISDDPPDDPPEFQTRMQQIKQEEEHRKKGLNPKDVQERAGYIVPDELVEPYEIVDPPLSEAPTPPPKDDFKFFIFF